jgi:hypothetical protein
MVSMTSTLEQRESIYANGTASRPDDSGDRRIADGGDFIDETVAIWQRRSSRQLSREDGREIIENMTGFFRILQEWDRAERTAKADASVV